MKEKTIHGGGTACERRRGRGESKSGKGVAIAGGVWPVSEARRSQAVVVSEPAIPVALTGRKA